MRTILDDLKASGKKKWLLLIPFIVLAFLLWFQAISGSAIEQLLLQEKAHERRQHTEFIHAMMETFIEKGINTEHRGDILVAAVTYIEANFDSTFAQVYDGQLNPLNNLHPGIGGGQKHNPLDYPEFVYAVQNNEAGDLIYWYETPQAGGRDVYMTFRWMPTAPDNPERFLVAIGISKYSITTHIPKIFDAVIWFMIFAVTLTMLFMFYVIIRQTTRVDKLKRIMIQLTNTQKEGG